MNIFKILANGDGTLNEPNVSAFLGYLLDPNADHGLGFEFLESFIHKYYDEDFQVKKYDYEIIFESAFNEENNKKNKKEIVDIVIVCFDNQAKKGEKYLHNLLTGNRIVKQLFLIEIKINKSSFIEKQIKNQYDSTVSELEVILTNETFDKNSVYTLYITPNNPKYKVEFSNYNNEIKGSHIIWKDDFEDKNTVVFLLKEIIRKESNGDINAVNEYTKHTIKSFIQFIYNDFKSEKKEQKERINDGTYIQKYKNLNLNSGIEDKLNAIKFEIEIRNPELIGLISDANLSRADYPCLQIKINDIIIEIAANSVSRKSVSFNFRLNSKIEVKSKTKLNEIANKLKIVVKNANSARAYCKTEEMNEHIPLENYNIIDQTIKNLLKVTNI
ncbi:MAG: PD-(D/E)XK nuclease family protein [Saprospiraceae bacterium]|nr:PD-(D/E)XK nuclease family protein [Candidatus Vicinibacter affinis]